MLGASRRGLRLSVEMVVRFICCLHPRCCRDRVDASFKALDQKRRDEQDIISISHTQFFVISGMARDRVLELAIKIEGRRSIARKGKAIVVGGRAEGIQ
jgi:hypothetical protein